MDVHDKIDVLARRLLSAYATLVRTAAVPGGAHEADIAAVQRTCAVETLTLAAEETLMLIYDLKVQLVASASQRALR
jgi:hypothetical protein